VVGCLFANLASVDFAKLAAGRRRVLEFDAPPALGSVRFQLQQPHQQQQQQLDLVKELRRRRHKIGREFFVR
jgi:hypothetical protein